MGCARLAMQINGVSADLLNGGESNGRAIYSVLLGLPKLNIKGCLSSSGAVVRFVGVKIRGNQKAADATILTLIMITGAGRFGGCYVFDVITA